MSEPPRSPPGSLPLSRLAEPVLRRLSELLDRAAPGKGWRDLAQRAGSRGRVRLSPLDLEQCSLKVLEPEGSPSWSLLKLLGDRGCTVVELVEFLQALEHTEALQCLSYSGIKIVIQPDSQAVLSGQIVKLCCWATGHPFVHYQWFKQEKEVPYGNSPELVLNPVKVNDAGFYICRVNSESSFAFSQWARLEVCDLQGASHGSLISLPEKKICICIQPQPQNLTVGDALVLECRAVGNPIPQYQWFRNGFPLANGSKNVYMVTCVDMEHGGTYWCHVFNDQEDQDSKKIEVVVGRKSMAVECTEEDLSDLQKTDLQEQSSDRPFATDKVALLIGNMNYWNHPRLKAPMVDVYELTNLLRQMDFKVVSLLDLTESEMRNAVDEFLLLLDRGVYGLLYYAGHGYENYGNSFMVPIDAPNPYRSANCLCVQNILKLMQEKETGLNVFLLDMCRKRNEYDDTILILDALKVTANIVFGYATCQGAEAFEIQQSGLANGIFMKFLKERLLEDKKITVLLDEVAEDMGKCHLTKGKQALEIRSSLSEKRALTDPIQQTISSAESMARNLQWAKAHELPESMYLEFKCGVQIQLGFAAEFSNVMIIYTRIVKKPPEIVVCRAYVTDFALDLDVDPKEANKGTPEETGSYLVSKDLPKHCLYTRLSSLQKLKEHLIFTVCLHYEYPGIEDTMDERKEVNVGKPLIAKLGLHHGFKNNCLQTCCVTNNPFHNQVESSPVATKYYFPSHCQPNSCPGIYHGNHTCSDSIRQPEACSCNGTSRILASRHEVQNYSSPAQKSNVPVETTDDTVELEFLLSDSLRFSKQQ
ncbi:mucosa-associated lymphoid tissue lymphoma translocation protein 1 isoform X1 [Anser cygnoides]|uniref:Paracaspase n=2 Tax=Anser TaxID=8842 RepID=A0A8B9CWQ8_9AVES|nr:mucosa-associated lymphoid tissue lymphoma translocation protein 1 isoform X1 [Anser cygnoides]XP_047935686.1 mucosa-associated lymphoid tissue lymphoma translocation protein 1 isoform X1 [Anser cygnoides]XP_047935687.1 mucosa-associated lymphoid tissue lymphoma translocation protein 1 isoform X1 [Anser cygnoides]